MTKKLKAVLYRHNTALAALVAKANPDFVHEFPAEMSVKDIKQELPKVAKLLIDQARASGLEGWEVHVDGTVMLADISASLWSPISLYLIRQDNAGTYDWYAAQVAEAAKEATIYGNPTVIVVCDRIADHNSETWECGRDYDRDGLARLEVELATVRKWVERLQKLEIITEVVAAHWFEQGLKFGHENLRGKVVVCDHHNSTDLKNLIRENGGIWFNAFTQCSDNDFLAT